MDGKKTSAVTVKNNPVGDFISYLIKQLPETDYAAEKQKKMKSVIRELKNVEFSLDSKSSRTLTLFLLGSVANTAAIKSHYIHCLKIAFMKHLLCHRF
jgi:hypothetical protein